VFILATDLKTNRSTYEILQVIGISLLDKTHANELLKIIDYEDVKELGYPFFDTTIKSGQGVFYVLSLIALANTE